MLWFRVGVFSACGGCLFLSVIMLSSVIVMCINPANGRAMNSDPYYNGTLSYYAVVILAQMAMAGSTAFGMLLAFKVWRNNHQMDHKLRHLFSIWLLILCVSSLTNFILGIMGMINYRQPQEEIMAYYEIFSKYNQDVKFVGSFERYQRENSCCGINGPDDWMMAQLKQGGGGGGGGMGMGGMGGMDSYMGSPSTGKCHLTPPTIPMGCGKKLLDDIHWTMTVYACILLLETIVGIFAAGLGWYSFFYWIEKEVIIIPEDEVSNLIVIEPESSTSSYTTVTATPSSVGSVVSGWSRSNYSIEGSRYSNFTKPPDSRSTNYNSRSTNQSGSGRTGRSGRTNRTGTGYPYPAPPTLYSGSARPNQTGTRVASGHQPSGFVPNTPRPQSANRVSKFSNFSGAIPSVGGPHSAYLSMQMVDPNDETESITRNIQNIISDKLVPHSVSDADKKPPPLDDIRLHQGSRAPSVVYHPNQSHIPTGFWESAQSSAYLSGVQTGYGPGSGYASGSGYGPGSGYGSGSGYVSQDVTLFSSSGGGGSSVGSSTVGDSLVSGSYMKSSSIIYKKTKRVKKKHSPHHMLHKQEQALGGRVLAEMHVDHSRDPDRMPSNMSTSEVRRGHKAHHATIALIKNRKPPKPKELFSGPEKGHGQTGHLATDILEMSGGAGAAKSMIDNVNLPVEHNPSLTDGISEPYLKKLRDKKKKKLGGVDHPDHDHPGHGPVATTMSGVVEAPSIDGSQAQLLVDNLFAPKPKPKPPSEDKIKPHEVNADENEEEDENFNSISSHHHGSHHHGSHHHGSHHHGSHHHGSHHHGHSQVSHRSQYSNRSKNHSHHSGHHEHHGHHHGASHSHAGSHHHSHHHGHEHHHHDGGSLRHSHHHGHEHHHDHHGGSVRTHHHENHSHHHDHPHHDHHAHESHFSHHPHHPHGHHTAGPSMAHHHHHTPPTEVLYKSDRPLD